MTLPLHSAYPGAFYPGSAYPSDPGDVSGGSYTANVALSATGNLIAASRGVKFTATVPLSMTGALVAVGHVGASPAQLSVTGTLVALGNASGSAVALSGSGSLTSSGKPHFVSTATLAVTTSLQTGGHGFSTLDLSGTGTLQTNGNPRFITSANLFSTNLLTAVAGAPHFSAQVTLGVVGDLGTFASNPKMTGVVTLGMVGQLLAGGVVPGALGVVGELDADGHPNFIAPTDLSLDGELVTTSSQGINGSDSIELFAHFTLDCVGKAHLVNRPVPSSWSKRPYYVRNRQGWAIEQERKRHNEAMYWTGEPAMFVLMWRVEDFEAGLVPHCPRCALSDGSLDSRIAQIYKQPQTNKCAWCYGTTFYGGVRARIIRPAIFTDTDEDEKPGARGVTHAEQVSLQSTWDFRVRSGDYVFRRDGSRWQLGHPERVQLRTGYEHPTQEGESIGYSSIPAQREDKSTVAFMIAPSPNDLVAALQEPLRIPPHRGTGDELYGPLVPAGEFQ